MIETKEVQQHTPGPWFVDRNHADKAIGIASVRRKYDLDFVCTFADEMNEQDAKLIAAAPALLEACLSALKFNENPTLEPGLSDELEIQLKAAVTEAGWRKA